MFYKPTLLFSLTTLLCACSSGQATPRTSSELDTSAALYSIDTGHTITKVRTGQNAQGSFIVAAGYDGEIMGINFEGQTLWQNDLSGYMTHDLWVADVTQDGIDEIFVANADGHVYCLANNGELLWSYKASEAPMYAITVVNKEGKSYIAAGSYDKSVYLLDNQGKLVKEIKSSTYSNVRAWNKKGAHEPGTRQAPSKQHIANFLRPLKQATGDDVLVMHATINSMQSAGTLYFFNPLEDKPFKTVDLKKAKTPMGDMRIEDVNQDGYQDVILGSTKMKGQNFSIYDGKSGKLSSVPLGKINRIFNKFGYRVTQTELVSNQGEETLFVLYGNSVALLPADAIDRHKGKVLTGNYSFNDLWKDPSSGKLLLASSQSGGSAVHVLDTSKANWQQQFVKLNPPGKIAAILANTEKARLELQQFKASKLERAPLPVYLMSDSSKTSKSVMDSIHKHYTSPVFLKYGSLGSEKWDRSTIENKVYRNKRDKRQKYNLSQAQIMKKAKKLYASDKGAAFWGAHGNDPYYRSLETQIKTIELADGKKTVMIFPEVAHYDKDFVETLDALIFPLAKASQGTNTNIFLRNKHTFWQSHIYKEGWSRLLSGEYADVFVPAMEETTDKSMDLSIAARTGLWASGVVNQWGTRFSRDNTSYDRLRQHSHQMLPNHALRQYVYHIANGATFVNNFIVDQDYIKLLWDLIGQGALYVPKPNEIVSYSPVHLSMTKPDGHYVDEGNNVKWTNMFDAQVEANNPMVFSHLNGSWPGSPVTEWDFSRYAAGVKDRHLNYLPPYPNGLVMIMPPQQGTFADTDAPRGKLVDRLHPIYRNITEEFVTNGRDYFSADGKNTYSATEYYQHVAQAIEQKAKLLPITVSGDVAWVVAQTSPKNLRLTLIDGGYINPKKSTAKISFNTINPVKVKDILEGSEFKVSNKSTSIDVPTGLFRFIDIELEQPL